MIYTVGGIKGGTGKTTVATHLTIMLAHAGRDVLLVDADEQGTATDFSTWRNERLGDDAGFTTIQLFGSAVRNEVQKLARKYRDVVIDTGGRDTTSQRAALTISDRFLVPFVPRSFDLWTLERVAALVEEIRAVNPKLEAFSFLNRAFPRGSDNDEASAHLLENQELTFLACPLIERKVYSNASAEGLAITEWTPKNPKAIAELTAFFEHCLRLAVSHPQYQEPGRNP